MHIAIRLREIIAALDRRTPRPNGRDESTIAQEAQQLRAQAVEQLRRVENSEEL